MRHRGFESRQTIEVIGDVVKRSGQDEIVWRRLSFGGNLVCSAGQNRSLLCPCKIKKKKCKDEYARLEEVTWDNLAPAKRTDCAFIVRIAKEPQRRKGRRARVREEGRPRGHLGQFQRDCKLERRQMNPYQFQRSRLYRIIIGVLGKRGRYVLPIASPKSITDGTTRNDNAHLFRNLKGIIECESGDDF